MQPQTGRGLRRAGVEDRPVLQVLHHVVLDLDGQRVRRRESDLDAVRVALADLRDTVLESDGVIDVARRGSRTAVTQPDISQRTRLRRNELRHTGPRQRIRRYRAGVGTPVT